MTDSAASQERFAQWLLFHRISYKVTVTDTLPYDADLYDEINNPKNAIFPEKRKIRHYYVDRRFPDPTSFIPSSCFYQLKAFYQDLNSLSLNPDKIVLNDNGDPLLEYIRSEGKGDFEPVWSDTRIQNPAEMFLPVNQKLIVEKMERKNVEFNLDSRKGERFIGTSFSNNRMCTYGKWLIIGSGTKITRIKMDDEIDKDIADLKKEFDLHSWVLDEPYDADYYLTVKHEYYDERDLFINVIKICKFQTRDLLCIGTSGGLAMMIDLNHWIAHDGHVLGIPNDDHDLDIPLDEPDVELPCDYHCCDTYTYSGKVSAFPVMVFQTKDSVWSIDMINVSPTETYIAIGNNGPGIMFFRVKGFRTVARYMIATPHNVPSLSFINGSLDKDGYVTLSYVTVKGSMSVMKIRSIGHDWDVIRLDTQLFDEMAWSVTPLKRSQFLTVDMFELLNLNFKDFFKRSILTSIMMDTQIIDGSLPNPYVSDRLGPGAMTTQIPVSTVNLAWRLRKGISDPHFKLRFTTFDTEGKIDSATLIPGDDQGLDWMNLNTRTELRSIERVHLDDKINPLEHYYIGTDNYRSCFSGTDTQRYEKQWNNGFSTRPSSSSSSSNSRTSSNSRIVSPKLNETNTQPGKPNRIVTSHNFDDRFRRYHHSRFREITYSPSLSFDIINWIENPTFGTWAKLEDEQPNELPSLTMNLGPLAMKQLLNDREHEELVTLDKHTADFGDPPITAATTDSHFADDDNNDEDGLNRKMEFAHKEQAIWSLHNHVSKVRKYMEFLAIKRGDQQVSDKETKILDNMNDRDDDFLLVTTETHIFLLKLYPLIITSFTPDRIFPIDDISLCCFYGEKHALNRINFVTFIPELHCIVVASQLGLISLLRLTEFKGILSFRQEYIVGWQSQDPNRPNEGVDLCIRETALGRDNGTNYCGIDDVGFPLFSIRGMDYTWIPYNRSSKTGGYAILFVMSLSHLHRYKIIAGASPVKL